MSGLGIDAKLEELCEALVFIEPEDSASLEDFSAQLLDLLAHIQHEMHSVARSAISAAGEIVQKLIAGDSDDPATSLQILADTISALQGIFRDGRSPDSVEFPGALGLESGSTSLGTGTGLKIDAIILQEFLSHQGHVMHDLESLLLHLEEHQDVESYDSARRLLHTLKGEAGLLGLGDVELLCHAAEDAMEDYSISQMIDPLLAVKDWLDSALVAYAHGDEPDEDVSEALQTLFAAGKTSKSPEPPEPQAKGTAPSTPGGTKPVLDADHPLVDVIDESMISDFLARQPLVLAEFERLILALENATNQDELAELKRLVHTLKGESSLLGFTGVERICHALEDALVTCPVSALIDAMLQANDWVSRLFAAHAGKGEMPGPYEEILRALAQVSGTDAGQRADDSKNASDSPTEPHIIEDQHKPAITRFVSEISDQLEVADGHILEINTDSENTDALDAALDIFKSIKERARPLGLSEIDILADEIETMLTQARNQELALTGFTLDIVLEACDLMGQLVDALRTSLSSGNPLPPAPELPELVARMRVTEYASPDSDLIRVEEQSNTYETDRRLGDILVESGIVTAEDVTAALARQRAEDEPSENSQKETLAGQGGRPLDGSNPKHRKLGEILVESGATSAKEVIHSLRAQKKTSKTKVRVKESVKVDAERLNLLVDMIGELVIAESMFSMSPQLREGASPELLRQLSQLDKITRELQEIGTTLRLVPIRATFQKMARLVRDLSKKSGKPVQFVMKGEDTELDKTLVDCIGDPLVHLIRNAMDHGLEANPEDRIAAGKPASGTVELRAFHRGGNIHIEIQDDGRGLDYEAILKKARGAGLVGDSDSPSERELQNLIFEPGFSTAKNVTAVSGRGVGMDVVRRSIRDLRGTIEIISNPGEGTTFSIRLPLTLAIIDGMVVRCRSERFILPTLAVKRLIRPKDSDYSSIFEKEEVLNVEGNLVPLTYLHKIFTLNGATESTSDSGDEEVVVVLEHDNQLMALKVDEVLGQQQTVIKPLGRVFEFSRGIAGGAIMPDGRVGLILDIGGLIALAQGSDHETSAATGQNGIPGPEHFATQAIGEIVQN